MVLADTSVWIRFLGGAEPYTELRPLLLSRQVAGHELVFGELLIGDRGGRRVLLDSYSQMRYAPLVPHVEVTTLVRARKLHGAGIGWIDAHLLASALVAGFTLWSADEALTKAAEKLGIAHRR